MVTADTFVCHVQQKHFSMVWLTNSVAQNDYLEIIHLSVQQSEKDRAKTDFSIEFCWNVFVSPFHDAEKSRERKRIDFTFWLDFYVDATVCPVMNVLSHGDFSVFASSYSHRRLEYLSLNLINLISAACYIQPVNPSNGDDWLISKRKHTPKNIDTKKSAKKKDIEFRSFESHAKININPHSHVVYF